MTTPAYPNPTSIQDVKTEFVVMYGQYNDLNNWGSLVLGRTPGTAVSLSEFWGLTGERKYAGYVGPPAYDTGHNIAIATAWGTAQVGWSNGDGAFAIRYWLYEGGGAAVWNHFVRVELPNGSSIAKSSFAGPLRESPQPKWSFMYHNIAATMTTGNLYWVFR